MKKIFYLLIMFVTMTAQVTIGNVVFDHITSAEINQSVTDLSNTAFITVPKNYALKDKKLLDYIKVGQTCEIKLGYDGSLETEFTGYVTKIGSGTPVRIEMEDEMYKLRKLFYTKNWNNVSLTDLLNFIAPGYKIESDKMNIGKFKIKAGSAYMVLEKLKATDYGLYSYFDDKKTLHCSFMPDIRSDNNKAHVYDFLINVPRDGNNLTYKRAGDIDIRIKAISTLSSGKKITTEIGSKKNDASVRTLNFRNKTKAELTTLAEQELKRIDFSGYEGSISGFGFPKTNAGDNIELKNNDVEPTGTYMIESVHITYTNSKFRRKNKLSFKL